MLLRGPNPIVSDAAGNTALHFASLADRPITFRTLLSSLAPEALFRLATAKNAEGDTALHLAAKLLNLEMTTHMLQAGMSANMRDSHGRTPLMRILMQAKTPRALAIFKMLVEANTDLDACDNAGVKTANYPDKYGNPEWNSLLGDRLGQSTAQGEPWS